MESPSPYPSLEPGSSLGKYLLLQMLGQGGMGTVFLAEDTLLRRKVAVKVMLPAFASHSPNAKARFLREARSAARLEHERVVRIYEVGEDRGIPFIAMELLSGESLQSRLDRAPRPGLPFAMEVTRQVAEGLLVAHHSGLIHRDVKPGNVWLTGSIRDGSWHVKLLDFGLARTAEGDTDLTGTGAFVGTPNYMSPEQGRGKEIDHRSDLFALGVMLYRMSTGQFPFRGSSAFEVMYQAAYEEPVPVAEYNPQVPPGLEQLIRRLLAKNPADRPADAEAVIRAIEALRGPDAPRPGPRSSASEESDAGFEPVTFPPHFPTDGLPVSGTAPVGLGTQIQPQPEVPNRGGTVGFSPSDFDPAPEAPPPSERRPGEPRWVELGSLRGKSVRMEFVWIPPSRRAVMLGSPRFERELVWETIGSRHLQRGAERYDTEEEVRVESIGGFYLGKYPVTQEEYETLTGENPSLFRPNHPALRSAAEDTSRHPVENVSWSAAMAFAQLLTPRLADGGGTPDLPTEQEWEYACRGGQGNRQPYFWGNDLNGSKANCDGRFPFVIEDDGPFLGRTTAVNRFGEALHPWGLADLYGNVREWCKNRWDPASTDWAARGGSWCDPAWDCRSASRFKVPPHFALGGLIGFRLLLRVE